MIDYHLRFSDEATANTVISEVIAGLKPYDYVVHAMGEYVVYSYDDSNPDADPIKTVIDARWHVDVRLREPNAVLDAYRVYPDTPAHQFS